MSSRNRRIHPRSTANANTHRYTGARAGSISVSDEPGQQNWIVYALGLFVLLGIGFISAISYILLLG